MPAGIVARRYIALRYSSDHYLFTIDMVFASTAVIAPARS
jgi:hypothetical protein